MHHSWERNYVRIALLAAAAVLLCGAAIEFYQFAWGTGTWYGEFSPKWGVAFVLFVVLCVSLAAVWGLFIWGRLGSTQGMGDRLPGPVRWLLCLMIVVTPIVFLQYSAWGVVISGPYLRLLIWALCLVLLVQFMMAGRSSQLLPRLSAAILISGSAFLVAAALTEVTDYPFSLGWSEGNRLWDYSLLFGKHLYSYSPDQEPFAYLDFGRQLIGGLPFLLPSLSIVSARLWLAAMATVPYWLVGLLTFRPRQTSESNKWLMASLFGFLFLSQGPIHAPLMLCALLVAAAWRLPAGWGLPLLVIAGYFAEVSRFTWMFAPAMWAVMLELGSADASKERIGAHTWQRAILFGTAGLAGSALGFAGFFPFSVASAGSSAAVSSSQSLLWYRLLPNATYGDGILLGLAKASLPLVVVLAYAGWRLWHPRPIQLLTLVLSLMAFLVVGLVVSTKIGGGGDLHNLDMFLIGLAFAAGIVWGAAAEKRQGTVVCLPAWMQAVVVLMLAIPVYGPLMALRPLSFADDADWLSVLTDVERARDLGSLPSQEFTEASLTEIRAAVQEATGTGDVLFMDQRQLLTFGYVEDVRLISDYDKKRLMDEALSQNDAYFRSFYRDLQAHRFALLISSPLRTPIRDRQYGFGEENNAWVEWVARPVLCYYEERDTLDAVRVELLVPRTAPKDCSAELPVAMP